MIVSKGITVNTTDTLIDGAKNTRSYVGIQNQDAANSIFIAFGGQTATTSNSVEIKAGEYFDTHAPFNGSEIRGIAETGAVSALLMTD